MKPILPALALLFVLVLGAAGAEARGCIKGAIAGGIAGHFAHHGTAGAAADARSAPYGAPA